MALCMARCCETFSNSGSLLLDMGGYLDEHHATCRPRITAKTHTHPFPNLLPITNHLFPTPLINPFITQSTMSEAALAAVVKRLEAATLRLEEIARTKAPSGGASSQGTNNPIASDNGAVSPSVAGFDELIGGPLQEYLKLSAGVGGLVQEQVGFNVEESGNSPDVLTPLSFP